MVFTTVSLNGSKEFTAWEWTARGVVKKEMEGVPYKVGEGFEAVGVSLVWWQGEKIGKLVEYSKSL